MSESYMEKAGETQEALKVDKRPDQGLVKAWIVFQEDGMKTQTEEGG